MTWFTDFLLRAMVFFRRRALRVVPLPRHHGQVAPLLREQRDAGLVLVLGLLAGPLGHRPAHDCQHRRQVRPAPPDHRQAAHERGRAAGPPSRARVLLSCHASTAC